MRKAWMFTLAGLGLMALGFASLLWLLIAPASATDAALSRGAAVFEYTVYATPFGFILLLLGFLGGGVSAPKDGGATAATVMAASLLIGSKKDLTGM